MWNQCLFTCRQEDPDTLPELSAVDIEKYINFTSPHGDTYTVRASSGVTAVDYRSHFALSLTMPVRESDIARFSSVVKSVWNSSKGKYTTTSL